MHEIAATLQGAGMPPEISPGRRGNLRDAAGVQECGWGLDGRCAAQTAMKLACCFVTAAVFAVAQTGAYQDPQKRFEFVYPAAFGATSAGTDSGFGDPMTMLLLFSGKTIIGELLQNQTLPHCVSGNRFTGQ
jgi:hypothetical protein